MLIKNFYRQYFKIPNIGLTFPYYGQLIADDGSYQLFALTVVEDGSVDSLDVAEREQLMQAIVAARGRDDYISLVEVEYKTADINVNQAVIERQY